MKIKLKTSVAIEGRVMQPGAEIEVSESVGRDLVNRKRAESLEAPKEAGVITADALEDKPKRGRPRKSENDAGSEEGAE